MEKIAKFSEKDTLKTHYEHHFKLNLFEFF
jgi:hypothetical protein